MFLNRLMCFCVLLLGAAESYAQDQPRQPKRPAAGAERTGGLVGKGLLQQLKLSAEQQAKLTQLEKEFTPKIQDEGKILTRMQQARQDMDRAAYQKAQQELDDLRQTRAEFSKQFKALLTPEQLKTYDQIAAAAPRLGARSVAPPSLLSAPGLLERLQLSADQKEKLNQLQKEFEAKALQVLNEEQRQQYERLKQVRPRRKTDERE
jgi:hypothetical protein